MQILRAGEQGQISGSELSELVLEIGPDGSALYECAVSDSALNVPASPEAKNIDTPCRPSFMNLMWLSILNSGRSTAAPPTHCTASSGNKQAYQLPDRRTISK